MTSESNEMTPRPPSNGDGEQPNGHDSDERERQFTFSISEEDRQKSFEIEDKRWSRSEQIKDWLKLGLMMAIMLGWGLLVYFLEPGLR